MLRASLLAIAVVVSGLPAQANWMENLLRGGKYPSAAQAKEACNTWASKGPKVSFKRQMTYGGRGEMRESTIRKCEWESVTKQFLGYQSTSLKEGDVVEGGPWYSLPLGSVEVKRNFRY